MKDTKDIKPAISINVAEETAKVQKEVVEKGKVRIIKKVKEEQETVTTPVTNEEVSIEKIPVNKLSKFCGEKNVGVPPPKCSSRIIGFSSINAQYNFHSFKTALI